jgi:Zn-dependent protease
VNFSNLRHGRVGFVLVSAAGIAANTLMALAAFILNRLLSPPPSGVLAPLLYYLAQVNIMLAAFNLIPIPPLDGSKILLGFTSGAVQRFLLGLERYGFFIIIGLLYLGILDPLIGFFRWMLLMLIRFLLP